MESSTRNEEILRSIEEEKIPVLPFELTIAKNALQSHVLRQQDLSAKMNEAMSQSSETWHDNAPAEAIANESQGLSRAAEQTLKIINKAEVFDYESNPDDTITLGSVVEVRYGNAPSLDTFAVTGATRELPEDIGSSLTNREEIEVITLSSPVAKVLFGKKAGDQVEFKAPNGRDIKLSIESVKSIY